MTKIPFLLLLILAFLSNLIYSELRFVFEMFRHGARGPWTRLDKNNLDIFGEEWSGEGELTGVGMRQHYLLGHRNRIKYDGYLSQSYDPREVFIVSTDVNRTIMSAYSQLQGLYPNGTGPALNTFQISVAIPPTNDTDFLAEKEKLGVDALPNQMQVLPIHLFDKSAHRFGNHDSINCPSVGPLVEKNKQMQIFRDYYIKFYATWGEKLKTALNVSGEDFFFNYDNVYSICDTFVSDYTEGHNLTILTNAGIDLDLFNKTAIDFMYLDILYGGFGDKDSVIAKVSISPTAFDILTWMDKRISLDGEKLGYYGYGSNKMVMYSAHDTNMAAIQVYLQSVFNKTQLYYTPFASSIFFELHRKDNTTTNLEDYYVTVIYNDIYLLNMTYNDFSSGVKKNSFDDSYIDDFCKFDKKVNSNPLLISTIGLGVLSFGLLAYVVFTCFKKVKETPSGGYNNI